MKALKEAFQTPSLRNVKENFGTSTKMVDSETPKCEQQAVPAAVPAKSSRRKECDHVRSAFRFDK